MSEVDQPDTNRTTEQRHTPGPWRLVRMDDAERYDIGVSRDLPGFRLVATVDFGFVEPAETEQHANARLIAAAPDLLQAAKHWLHLHEQGMVSREAATKMYDSGQIPSAIETLRAAIAKAEGRS